VQLALQSGGPIAAYSRERAAALLQDHDRVRSALSQTGGVPRVTVEPVLPADVVGLFVLIPEASKMARVRKSDFAFDAISLEGSLISPAKLAAVAERKATDQTDAGYHIPKGLTLRDETARYFRIGQALFRELFAGAHPSSRPPSIYTGTPARRLRLHGHRAGHSAQSPRRTHLHPHA